MSEHISVRRSYGADHNEVRRNLVREMNRLGAYSLEGEYSGGHDEGGLDYLTLFDKAGEKIELEEGRRNGIYEAVQDLLDTKFGTWALGVSVYGHVYVDLKTKRAWTEGSEEVMEYRDDTDPIDMRW